MSSINYDETIQAYIDICNQAIDLHKERFPFRQIWGAADLSSQGLIVEVKLKDVVPNLSYIMHVDQEKISLLFEEVELCFERVWQVPFSYLSDVVGVPEKYIRNPALLDWSWLIQAEGS